MGILVADNIKLSHVLKDRPILREELDIFFIAKCFSKSIQFTYIPCHECLDLRIILPYICTQIIRPPTPYALQFTHKNNLVFARPFLENPNKVISHQPERHNETPEPPEILNTQLHCATSCQVFVTNVESSLMTSANVGHYSLELATHDKKQRNTMNP